MTHLAHMKGVCGEFITKARKKEESVFKFIYTDLECFLLSK